MKRSFTNAIKLDMPVVKGWICFAFLFLNVLVAKAQVFYTENFSTGGAGWNLAVSTGANGADPNFFNVSANEG
ncbi:MAG: hypothetical protein L6Q66_06075, partial [Bacteroidia bacterium]|nr:hypothetical protein [Bacteroidia bacterium]